MDLILSDGMNRLLSLAFAAVTLASVIYALPFEKKSFYLLAGLYVLSGFGAIFSRHTLIFLFFWDALAVTSYLLIVREGHEEARAAGLQYIILQFLGAAAMFIGMAVQVAGAQSWELGAVEKPAQPWVFIGVSVKTGALPFQFWLPRAYSQTSFPAAALMAAISTKVGIYAAARLLPGYLPLSYLGVFSALYGVAYALVQGEGRRLLSYHIASQIGYILTGIGIGTPAALNGAILHAFNNALYKTLLIMGFGATATMAGTSWLGSPELGNYRKPSALAFWLLGSLAITGFPGLNGYVSKVVLMASLPFPLRESLELASIGTAISFSKFTYFAFLRRNTGENRSPLVPTGAWVPIPQALLAALCITFGFYPGAVASLLPYPGVFPGMEVFGVMEFLKSIATIFVGIGIFWVGLRAFAPHVRHIVDSNLMFSWALKMLDRLSERLSAAHTGRINDYLLWSLVISAIVLLAVIIFSDKV